MFQVSHSKVKCWRHCHRQYHYRYILKLRKRIKGFHLYLGTIVHSCIESFLTTGKYSKVLSEYRKEASKRLFDEEVEEAQEALDLSESMMLLYAKQYEEEEFEVTAVELDLTVPLMDDVELVLKIDGLARDEDDKNWMLEHKTCRVFPDEKVRMADIQTVIYQWALGEAGYDIPDGIIWDYLRKKSPGIPQVLKAGGLSKKKIITTHEVYLKAIKDNELDPEDYTEILESLENGEDNFLRRVKLPFSQTLLDNTLDDFKSSVTQMKRLGHIVTDRNPGGDCGFCDYFDLCQSDLRGLDTEFLIKKSFTTKEERDAQDKKESKKQEARNTR